MSHTPQAVAEPALPDTADLARQLEQALDALRAAGADSAEARLAVGRALSVEVRQGDLESVEFQADRDLAVTAYRGRRSATATTTDLSDEGIRSVTARAAAMAVHTGEDPWAGLADPDTLAREFPDLDLVHPWEPEVADARDLALACEAAALAADPRIHQSDGAAVETSDTVSAYANTHGFFGAERATRHGWGCTVIARADGQMQRDAWSSSARCRNDLEPVADVGRLAGGRAAARLGATTPSTCRAPVLLPPELARSLFGHLVGAISGGTLYRDASFAKDRLGDTLFPDWLSVIQRPHLRRAMASAAFDAEGVATTERPIVDRGVLADYLLGSYAARRLERRTTGNAGGAFNLCIEGGSGDRDALLRTMDTGLLVTQLMGQGVNLMTGDYSRGAAGFWVEQGRLVHPVQNVTIAGNLLDMFAGIVAAGDDPDCRGAIRAPSLLIGELTIAGQ
ncbi:metalloprotease PmbA [Spectribacter hydrogenoxidans]|uniref:Metalloprotease PmbA n=1 Tax=Spectribacter hydrogenoxidans TaxID=3075608 RepID=A0ABU3C105_9GAMM|nr:metalloprotease PmbA [Salinisphaera sp. W335]MDT0635247.1 metalloprotease PmbA [Salinisphaera sp. W335]